MNEQEIIEYLKKNKEDCVIFMKMPTPVQDWCKSKKGENIFMRLVYEGNEGIWTQTTERINCNCLCIYALPDDYEAPKVELEILEFDVTKDLMFDANQFFKNFQWRAYKDINTPTPQMQNAGIKYRFIGYKFEGYNDIENMYLKYQDLAWGRLHNTCTKGSIPVYANKVVYQKVEG